MAFFMQTVPIATTGPTTVSRAGSFFQQGRCLYDATNNQIGVVVMGDATAPAMSTTFHAVTNGQALPANIGQYIDSVNVNGTVTHVFQLVS